MKKKPLIPFSWMPGSWGLRGKTREIAQAEYELDQGDLQERLLEINFRDDPETLARKKLDLRLDFREISQYDYDRQVVTLTVKDPREHAIALLDVDLKHEKITTYDYDRQKISLTVTDESQKLLDLLEVDLKHEKITSVQYDRQKADILKEPWVSMPKINWDPVNSNRTYFELDYNDHFIQYLRDNGYSGSEDDILNRWLNDVCQAVAMENGTDGRDFILDNTR